MICNVCNVRRGKTGSKGTDTSPHSDMCNYCWEEGGWENTHSDEGHDSIAKAVSELGGDPATYLSEHQLAEYNSFMVHCWICHPELNLASTIKQSSTGAIRVQGDRRPQLNHKDHSHPQTPAARRACKALFWAMIKDSGLQGELLTGHLPGAMKMWDAKLDGSGKPLAKAAEWNVAPIGPKGGVRASLKAAASKVKETNSK